MEYIKVNDNEIKAVDTKTEVDEKVYTYEFLLSMKANLEAERIRVIAMLDKKLVEVNALIVEADKLGVTVKPEPIVVEPIDPLEYEEPIELIKK